MQDIVWWLKGNFRGRLVVQKVLAFCPEPRFPAQAVHSAEDALLTGGHFSSLGSHSIETRRPDLPVAWRAGFQRSHQMALVTR